VSELRTPRLLLRKWREEDREPFAALNADPHAMRFFTRTFTREESDEQVDRFIAHHDKHGYGLWVVDVEGAFAGFTGLMWTEGMPFSPALEIGWRFAQPFWGRGYATEAANAALAVGLAEAGFVVSFTAVQNEPSWRVMERISMRREGEFDHPRVPEGSPLRRHVLYRTPPGL
jgi:ribosomal-protein-alanine N-acetyltransferase